MILRRLYFIYANFAPIDVSVVAPPLSGKFFLAVGGLLGSVCDLCRSMPELEVTDTAPFSTVCMCKVSWPMELMTNSI